MASREIGVKRTDNERESISISEPEKCIWLRYNLDIWPLTLKISSAIPITRWLLWQVSLKSIH